MRPQSILNLHFWFARAFREGESIGKIMIIRHRMNSVGLFILKTMMIGHRMKLFILKTMMIGHRMKLFILMPGGSGLPSPDIAARKKYFTKILLATVLEG
jgi:hypothetical protein